MCLASPGSEVRHLTGLALARHGRELVAGLRRTVQAEHLHRCGRGCLGDVFAAFVGQCANPTEALAGNDDVAALQGSVLHQQRRDGAAASIQARLDDHALTGCLGHGGKFQEFGLQYHGFQ